MSSWRGQLPDVHLQSCAGWWQALGGRCSLSGTRARPCVVAGSAGPALRSVWVCSALSQSHTMFCTELESLGRSETPAPLLLSTRIQSSATYDKTFLVKTVSRFLLLIGFLIFIASPSLGLRPSPCGLHNEREITDVSGFPALPFLMPGP